MSKQVVSRQFLHKWLRVLYKISTVPKRTKFTAGTRITCTFKYSYSILLLHVVPVPYYMYMCV